jgi:hypothetical protein
MQVGFSLDAEIDVQVSMLINNPEKNCLSFALPGHSVSKLVDAFFSLRPCIIELNNLIIFVQGFQSIKIIESVDKDDSLEQFGSKGMVFLLFLSQ